MPHNGPYVARWYVHTKWWGTFGPYPLGVARVAARNVFNNTATKPRLSVTAALGSKTDPDPAQ